MVYDKQQGGKLVGAQAFGYAGVEKRIDAIAVGECGFRDGRRRERRAIIQGGREMKRDRGIGVHLAETKPTDVLAQRARMRRRRGKERARFPPYCKLLPILQILLLLHHTLKHTHMYTHSAARQHVFAGPGRGRFLLRAPLLLCERSP